MVSHANGSQHFNDTYKKVQHKTTGQCFFVDYVFAVATNLVLYTKNVTPVCVCDIPNVIIRCVTQQISSILFLQRSRSKLSQSLVT